MIQSGRSIDDLIGAIPQCIMQEQKHLKEQYQS